MEKTKHAILFFTVAIAINFMFSGCALVYRSMTGYKSNVQVISAPENLKVTEDGKPVPIVDYEEDMRAGDWVYTYTRKKLELDPRVSHKLKFSSRGKEFEAELVPRMNWNWIWAGWAFTAIDYATKAGYKFDDFNLADHMDVYNRYDSKFASTKEQEFIYAAMEGKEGKLEDMLKEGGIDMNAIDPTFGMAALHWAIIAEEDDAVEFLLENKANPDIRDDEGYTPLHRAVMMKSEDMVKLLKKYHADVNAKGPNGTAIEMAKALDEDDLVEALTN
ncbi:MAG: ankyrin repeat domain-containing protein [Ignavibacteria bacterium]|jgi:hypothetical protein|nr:ankyrin repeat domain-containing protein [Ignavibacteria bacterium]MCU7502836.1 ankyrin repeat domain-containing protein [Ignavibacteria bacterium]MCU7515670.1 ankyrin repeat domain-containing protein [Ignavibacteria bacterium]